MSEKFIPVQKYSIFSYVCKLLSNVAVRKKVLRFFRRALVALVIVVAAFVVALQAPAFQTYMAGRLLGSVNESISGKISAERVYVRFFNDILLQGVTVLDDARRSETVSDTLFHTEKIVLHYSLRGLFSKEGMEISRVSVRGGGLNLVLEDPEELVDGKSYTTNLTRIFGLASSDRDTVPEEVASGGKKGRLFELKDVRIKDFSFTMTDIASGNLAGNGDGMSSAFSSGKIDWADLHISDIDFHIKNMKMEDGIMYGNVLAGSFREKSGFNCRSITGNVRVGDGLTSIEGLRIVDDYSDARIGNYSMIYENTASFSDYISEVVMSMSLPDTCVINMATLSFFSEGLPRIGLDVSLAGNVRGTVDRLSSGGLYVGLPQYGVSMHFNGGIDGLPDIKRAYIDAGFRDLAFAADSLASLACLFSDTGLPSFFETMPYGGNLTFNGNFKGTLSALEGSGSLLSDSGDMDFEVFANGLLEDGDPLLLSGKVSTHGLDVGDFINAGILGPLTMNIDFRAGIGGGSAGTKALSGNAGHGSTWLEISSVDISRFEIKGYSYSGIRGNGLLRDNVFDGRIVCEDPNLRFMFQGVAALDPADADAVYEFYANVGYADLHAMNLDPRGKSVVSFRANSNFTKGTGGDMEGELEIRQLALENSFRSENAGDITVRISNDPRDYRASVVSDFINAEYEGSASIERFIKDFQALTIGKAADLVCPEDALTWSGNTYSLNVTTGNTMGVLSFLKPGLYVADKSFLSVSVDDEGRLDAGISSQRVAFMENYLKDLSFRMSNPDSTMDCVLRGSEAKAASVYFDNPRLSLAVLDNSVYSRLAYSNPGTDSVNSGRLNFSAYLAENDDGNLDYEVRLGSSEFFINGNKWEIRPAGIDFSRGGIFLDSLMISSGRQSIRVGGSASGDTLNVSITDFDISSLNPLFKEDYGLKGSLSGQVRIPQIFENAGLLMDLKGESIVISGKEAGDIDIMSRWDQPNRRFNIYFKNLIGQSNTFNVIGYYKPEDNYVRLNASLRGFTVDYFRPALSSVLSDITGALYGDISLSGDLDEPVLKSDRLLLDGVTATVAYTNVPYRLDGSLSMDDAGINMESVLVTDRFRNRGVLSGSISHDHFKDIVFGLDLKFNGLECVNVPAEKAGAFYGSAFATGSLQFSGPLSDLRLSANVATRENTSFHVPIASASQSGGTDILAFKDYSHSSVEEDPYDLLLSRMREDVGDKAGISLAFHLNVTPDARIFVELDGASGSMLSGQGSGILDILVEPDKDVFDIRGDYTLESGDFRFATGLVSRDFTIDEGSSIRFNGEIMDSDVDVNAIYSTKASIGTLIADTSSVSSRRTVDCTIGISGKLSDPNLRFGIDIPDLDPMVRAQVESALSTEDKIQKQFLSLMISNSFIPDEQSSIVNNSSLLFSNVSEVLSGQLSSIFQKLDIPLDLGVNYQQTSSGTDVFDVAVSTQLFNNRVIVNGNIGNRQNNVTGNNGVVGDIDIEIKLDKKGVLRLNLFSHSADQYSSYLDQSQRSGVGITYQQEFSTFRELWRKMFWGRKRKRQAEEAELRSMVENRSDNDSKIIEIKE